MPLGSTHIKFTTKRFSIIILVLAATFLVSCAAAEIPSKWDGNYVIVADKEGITWSYAPSKIEKLSDDTGAGEIIKAVIKIKALNPFVTEFQEIEIDPENRIFRLVTAEAYDEAENLLDL